MPIVRCSFLSWVKHVFLFFFSFICINARRNSFLKKFFFNFQKTSIFCQVWLSVQIYIAVFNAARTLSYAKFHSDFVQTSSVSGRELVVL